MVQQQGKHYRYKKLEFWAERGMITLVDQEKAEDNKADPFRAIQRIPYKEFMKRAVALRMTFTDMSYDEDRRLGRMLEEVVEACRLAKAQGDPTDMSVIDDAIKHQRRSSILTPGEVNSILGPVGGTKWKLKTPSSSPRNVLKDGGVQVVPDLTISPNDVARLKAVERKIQTTVK